ncbi:hypothetical protein CHS0354_013911 [Potamilus streckersoni]|uniref:Uncharacterized protein n=1 Tax=Potamilus streckersoni TaxID=2493646 RepID=A0AAE0RWM5_9BIVA|nr:hypothetical protein CHS0354_013911 [Potamilus streckersoni]
MNLNTFQDSGTSRASSFFIEDILLSKPKQLCRDYGGLSALIRPSFPAEFGYHCISAPPVFFPHILSHAQGLGTKQPEHPFLIPTTGISLTSLSVRLPVCMSHAKGISDTREYGIIQHRIK